MIEIKKLSEEEWEAYRELRLEALQHDPIAFGSSYNEEKDFSEEEWRKRTGNALFALSDGKPVGMIVYIFLRKLNVKHIANIYGVYVQEAYRAQGIGDMLLEKAIARIKENRDIIKINLNVNPDQTAALNLYKKHGFTVVGRLKKDLRVDGTFYDELMMEKHF